MEVSHNLFCIISANLLNNSGDNNGYKSNQSHCNGIIPSVLVPEREKDMRIQVTDAVPAQPMGERQCPQPQKESPVTSYSCRASKTK